MCRVKRKRWVLFLVLFIFAMTAQWPALQPAVAGLAVPARVVVQLDIDGAVGPATSEYISRNFDQAVADGAKMIILRLDTPGGLDTSMREIIKKIIASPLPVIGYVAPSGARAASAGTFILYACHVAAMAPATNLGAATPVQLVPLPDPAGQEDDKKPVQPGNAMTEKVINDAVAYIRGLATMRGRNAQWAEQAVREAASLPAEEALQQHVIDLLANDNADLLNQLDGRKVNVLGQEMVLQTAGAVIEYVAPDWRSQLLGVISNPNIAYILLLVGLYGIAMEFSNPGGVVPGTVGVICLLLALYSFQWLPVNYAGIALIVLGMGLMASEAFAPSFGILGIVGIGAFVFGSVVLIDAEAPGYGINIGLIGGFAFSSAAFFIFALGMLLQSRRRPVVSGFEEMLGDMGEAMDDFAETGLVRVHGETWRAHTDQPLHKNDKVRIIALEGLCLRVTPYQHQPEEKPSC